MKIDDLLIEHFEVFNDCYQVLHIDIKHDLLHEY